MVRKLVLNNGMRIVAEKMASVKSVSIGLWVNVGSRDEEAHEHGISHFLEHMFFKGTEKRSAKEIAREIDAIGGELNAFTSRETTTFYAKVLDDHLSKAVEILSDNFHSSTFDPREIEKEKQVVIEEIKMVEDDPEDLVHDLYTKDIWKGNTLGRPILGTMETISDMTRKKILRFLKRTYDPKQIVVSVAGHFDLPPLMKALEKAFGKYSAKEDRSSSEIGAPDEPPFPGEETEFRAGPPLHRDTGTAAPPSRPVCALCSQYRPGRQRQLASFPRGPGAAGARLFHLLLSLPLIKTGDSLPFMPGPAPRMRRR
ncbi:MAG: pitrilysin family protein [Candidatus Manganitrophus sp.]|nr:pitrilysin family protein [Candidatus Manganitrophus sp.]